jgi:cobyrinic acid a,c-diamide synthase
LPARPAERNPRPLSAIVVGGTHSGVGKTTIALGLIAALRRRGLVVQPFKVGPDFIDPLHHSQASGRRSRNLDGWMLTPEVNQVRFARATQDADAAIVEGVMGVYDGSEGKSDRGSTAEMAKLLNLPVLLVVDAAAMARSAAALIHGFISFDPGVQIAGVVLNRVGSQGHGEMIREAVGDRVRILGAIPRASDLVVPERHLGLYLPHEARADYVEQAADLIDVHVDVDELLLATRVTRNRVADWPVPGPPRVRIGVARDEAFCFYYEDNLELLAQEGAELVEFSPIRDPLPADLDGIYMGGGYPELYAEALAGNSETISGIRDLAAKGAPIYAECGGLMYLGQQLHVDDSSHPLCGVLPFSTKMPARLKLAYVEVLTSGGLLGSGRRVRGHVFHHSEMDGVPPPDCCFRLQTVKGDLSEEGYQVGNVLASYVHLHFASNPAVATAIVDACNAFRAARGARPLAPTNATAGR